MANDEHLTILQRGVRDWNRWREENRGIRPEFREAYFFGRNLSRANLRSANLQGANLHGADLSGTDLSWADLSEAKLVEAKLISADLRHADLIGADLGGTDLRRVNLVWANLKRANLSGADLRGAKFNSANLNHTFLADVDLSEIQGLETVNHFGPSEISISTIYRSKGKIPLKFLRGAGVPDNFITYMHSLAGNAFEYYSCFISYASQDQEFADRLFADLQADGVRCWFAPHHAQAGQKLHEQIDTAIRLHERALLVLSPHSIRSEWVKTEIAKARKREAKEGKKVLFPISLNIPYKDLKDWECFDADIGKDAAREILEYFSPDFTRWKEHDAYQEQFKKLLHAFKKANEPAAVDSKASK